MLLSSQCDSSKPFRNDSVLYFKRRDGIVFGFCATFPTSLVVTLATFYSFIYLFICTDLRTWCENLCEHGRLQDVAHSRSMLPKTVHLALLFSVCCGFTLSPPLLFPIVERWTGVAVFLPVNSSLFICGLLYQRNEPSSFVCLGLLFEERSGTPARVGAALAACNSHGLSGGHNLKISWVKIST